jgi:hypothetical protein
VCFGVGESKLGPLGTSAVVKLGKRGNKIREMLVQVYRDNAIKKTAV